MFVASLLFYLFGYTLFFISIARLGKVRLCYTLGFFLFMSIQYGPHTAMLLGMLRDSVVLGSNEINVYYNLVTGSVFIIIGALFILVSRVNLSVNANAPRPAASIPIRLSRRVVALAMLLTAVSVALQPGLNVTLEHVKYFLGTSAHSYVELRRIEFVDTPWAKYAALMRYGVLPVVYAYLVLYSIRQNSRIRMAIGFSVAIALVFIVAVQLNKFFYLYYSALALLIWLGIRSWNYHIISLHAVLRKAPVIIAILVVFFTAVALLYRFQYADAVSQGLVTQDDLDDTLVYRIFFSCSDALRLWIDYFGVTGRPKGLAIVGKLCAPLGLECFDPNSFIPFYYFGRELTTMQTGFIGTGFGMFGWAGVPIMSVLVVLVIWFNNSVLKGVVHRDLIRALAPVMFVNSFVLTSRELHTAVLSGGALLTSVTILVLFYRIKL